MIHIETQQVRRLLPRQIPAVLQPTVRSATPPNTPAHPKQSFSQIPHRTIPNLHPSPTQDKRAAPPLPKPRLLVHRCY